MSRHQVLFFPFQSPNSFYDIGTGAETLKLKPEWAHIKERDMGHTETPWTQYMSGPMIHGADGFYIGIMQGKNADKDAAYIVECVNSHASLVEEVEMLREALAGLVEKYEEIVTDDNAGRSLKDWDLVRAKEALEKTNA